MEKQRQRKMYPLLICIICNDSELSAILLGIRQQKSHNTNKPVLPNKSIPVVPYSQRTSRFDVCSAVHCDLRIGKGQRKTASCQCKELSKALVPNLTSMFGDQKKTCRSKIKSNSKKEDTYVVSLLYIIYNYMRYVHSNNIIHLDNLIQS